MDDILADGDTATATDMEMDTHIDGPPKAGPISPREPVGMRMHLSREPGGSSEPSAATDQTREPNSQMEDIVAEPDTGTATDDDMDTDRGRRTIMPQWGSDQDVKVLIDQIADQVCEKTYRPGSENDPDTCLHTPP